MPTVVDKPRIITELPPEALVQPCRDPYKPVTTTGQIVDQLIATRGALSECAAKVNGLRQWRTNVEQSQAEASPP